MSTAMERSAALRSLSRSSSTMPTHLALSVALTTAKALRKGQQHG